MQIHQLRYVLKIAEKKNFSAAARELFLAQPSLSQQIIKLEQELGIPLFIRHSKSVSLTEAGEHFVAAAERILNNIDQLSDRMEQFSRLQDGTLRIGMLWIAGYLNYPQILTDFHRKHPGINYKVTVDGSHALLKLLLARSINSAFIISHENILRKEEDLYYQKLQDDYYIAVVNKTHPFARKDVLKIEDFQGQNIIMPSKDSAFRKELEQVFDRYYVFPEIICETSQSDIGMQLAGQGLAIYFSSNSIAHTLKTENHVIVPLEPDLHRTIFYVTLKELLDYPITKAFTAFVKHYSFAALTPLAAESFSRS